MSKKQSDNGGEKKKRNMTPVELTGEARQIMDAEIATTGMTRTVFLTKLIRWFVSQDDVVRATILETIPESLRADVARMALERAAKKTK
jgi:hypothetical protein